ncbi:hypothetical protein [Candidatus Anaplasma sp. TIGMIC]|uniref:hypothetical protein n=1 Tax=Candidatus Anaplasma sp. TIGMIC TaxID=3020713 RepID=UPI00232BFB92|nr:hypothetical protein [Candidatus Anaplasma sp. TIGMIC]MDB1135766.1 hypothetical protein [Candidatus Anaplasma sp. TIGMIC]
MHDSVVAHRADDAVIAVQQDNVSKTVVITGVNARALRLLGFDNSNILLHSPLSSILDAKTNGTISSYLEYSDSGVDLADIVSKIRDFTFLNVVSEALPVRAKVFRTASKKNCLNYEILIRDTSISQKLDAFRRKKLPPGSSYKVDPDLGILDVASTLTEVGIICDFVQSMHVDVVLSVMAIDEPINNGEKSLSNVKHVLVNTLSANLRYSDIVGSLEGNKFMFALLGCSFENSFAAVSRIHSRVAEKLSTLFSDVSASCAYASLNIATNNTLLEDLNSILSLSQKSSRSVVRSLHVESTTLKRTC